MVASNERDVRIRLSAKDEASGVFASAGRNIRRSAAEISSAIQGPAVKNRFDGEEQIVRQREAGILRARRSMQVRERREAEIHNRLLVRDATEGPGNAGGEILGPAVKSRFDAHTQALRNEQAALIKSWKNQGVAAKIEEEAKAALLGAGEKSGEGFLEGLKKKFGARGPVKEVFETFFLGAGAVGGLEFIGNEIAAKFAEARESMRHMAESHATESDVASGLLGSIPLLGTAWKDALGLRDTVEDATGYIAKMAGLSAKVADGFFSAEARAARVAERLKEIQEREERVARSREGTEAIVRPINESASLSSAKTEMDRSLEENKQAWLKATGPILKELNSAPADIKGPDGKQLYKFKDEATGEFASEEDRAAYEDRQAKLREANETANNARLANEQRIRKEAKDGDALNREKAGGEANENDWAARHRADEQGLRESGNILTADLAQIKEAGEIKKRAIAEQAKEEVQARMKVLGETQKQAEDIVNPNRDKNLAAVKLDTETATAEKKEAARRDQLERERAFGSELESTQAETAASQFRAAGQAEEAEKVLRAESHRKRLANINTAAEKEKQAHGENAADIESHRGQLASAENESFAASEDARASERARALRGSGSVNIGESHLLTGAVGAAGLSSDPQTKTAKATADTAKFSEKTATFMEQLLAFVKANGGGNNFTFVDSL